jgi:hypothetical protein
MKSLGFNLVKLRTEYAPGPRLMTYMYIGMARPAVATVKTTAPEMIDRINLLFIIFLQIKHRRS